MFFTIPYFTTCFRRTSLDSSSSNAKNNQSNDETDECSTCTLEQVDVIEENVARSFCSLRSTAQSWSTLEAGALQLVTADELSSRTNNNEEDDNENDELWWGMDEDGCFVPTKLSSRSLEEEEGEEEEETCTAVHAKVLPPPIPSEIEVCVVLEEQEQEETWIFDAVEPLIQGRLPLENDHPLQLVANQLEDCLQKYLNDSSSCTASTGSTSAVLQDACHILQQCPEAAQVRYRPPLLAEHTQHSLHLSDAHSCYPLFFFSATGNLQGVKAAYHAFPEAIGHADHWLGTPLHYACYHAVDVAVVQYLLTKYPEAARTTNQHYQSPLHLACTRMSLHSQRTIELLVQVFPTAAKLVDQNGMTPLHKAASCRTVSLELVRVLVQAYHGATDCRDAHDERPYDLALRMGSASPAVLELLRTTPTTRRNTH
jgi:hypothetical protein